MRRERDIIRRVYWKRNTLKNEPELRFGEELVRPEMASETRR